MATTTITLPISSHDFIPELPKPVVVELNSVGRMVQWIRTSNSQSFVQKVVVHAVALLVALALLVSLVGIPILIYAAKETARQEEKAQYSKDYNHLLKIAAEHGKAHFKRGRIDAFEDIETKLSAATRKEMLRDVVTDTEDPLTIKDSELLLRAAVKYENFIAKYKLKIVCER